MVKLTTALVMALSAAVVHAQLPNGAGNAAGRTVNIVNSANVTTPEEILAANPELLAVAAGIIGSMNGGGAMGNGSRPLMPPASGNGTARKIPEGTEAPKSAAAGRSATGPAVGMLAGLLLSALL